jgi:hypothetical protein
LPKFQSSIIPNQNHIPSNLTKHLFQDALYLAVNVCVNEDYAPPTS